MKTSLGDSLPTPQQSWIQKATASSVPLPNLINKPTRDSTSQCDVRNNKQYTSDGENTIHISSCTTGRSAAALLIITHILELTAMLAATLSQLISSSFSSNINNSRITSTQSTSLFSSYPYGSSSFFVSLSHLCFLVAPLLIITTISLVWTLRAQDFSGRIVARLVCWILHFFQASLIWRYLKVQLAYDPGDVAELGTLRFVQVHIHTLPFLVLHTATALVAPKGLLLSFILGVALLISSVITIIISTAVRKLPNQSSLSPPNTSQVFDTSQISENDDSEREDPTARIIVGITTACNLWCRVISIATLFCLHIKWGGGFIFLHWLISFIWLCIQNNIELVAIDHTKKWIRRIYLGYLLVWDWHIFQDDISTLNICAQPRIPAAFYSIVTVQNITIVSIWFVFKYSSDPIIVPIATLASVSSSQIIALTLLGLSYYYYSSLKICATKITPISTLRRRSIIREKEKTNAIETEIITIPDKSGYPIKSSLVDFKDTREICEETVNKFQDDASLEDIKAKNTQKLHSAIAQSNEKYPIPLSKHILTSELPQSIFSYSSDMLPATTKSDRSSMENGSFNSRNTNTLVHIGPQSSEHENVYRAHGSFSDSFSSLSCGTNQFNVNSLPKCFGVAPNVKNNRSRAKRHTSCRNGFCHCKIFDIAHKCGENLEEEDLSQDQVENQDNGPHEKKSSAPNVSVVRGQQRFQVVCSACLHSHDPLLSRCESNCRHKTTLNVSKSCESAKGGSSTDYPSDTEITATVDTLSTISADSHSTYTTWPVGRGPGLAKLLSREKGGNDYVTAWLRHQQSRKYPPMPFTHQVPRRNRGARRHPPRQGARNRSTIFVQNLETIV